MTRAAGAIAVGVVLIGLHTGIGAQTIYRCGNQYTGVPCPNGRPLEADDPRTPAQRDDALRLVAAQRQQADEMERARLQREAAMRPALATALSRAPAPAAKPDTLPKRPGKKRGAKIKAEVPDSKREGGSVKGKR